MNNLMENDRGFTLIEIVIVIVVLGVLSGFTFGFIKYIVQTYTTGSKQRMLYQEASYTMERITRELRDAKSMCNSVGTCTPVDQPGDLDEITFQKVHTDSSIDGNTDVRFALVSEAGQYNIYRYSSDPGSSSDLFGSKVTGFNVRRVNDGTINESITLELVMTNGEYKVSLASTVSPRNLSTSYSNRCFNGDYEDFIQ